MTDLIDVITGDEPEFFAPASTDMIDGLASK